MCNSLPFFFDHPCHSHESGNLTSADAMVKVMEESFLRKWGSNNKNLRNQMVFRMPASTGMTGIRGNDRYYWQIRMLIVDNQVI